MTTIVGAEPGPNQEPGAPGFPEWVQGPKDLEASDPGSDCIMP